MKTRVFTDTVNGKERLIVIIDEPTQECKENIRKMFEAKEEVLPYTEPDMIQSGDYEEPDVIWNHDPDAKTCEVMVDSLANELNINGDDKTFYKAILNAKEFENLLMTTDAIYRKYKDNRCAVMAVRKALEKLKDTQTLEDNPIRSLQCLPTLSYPVLLNRCQKEKTGSFVEWFNSHDAAVKPSIIKGLINEIIEEISKNE